MANRLFARKPLSLLFEEMNGEHRLRRVLGPVQLTSLGVGAIIEIWYVEWHSGGQSVRRANPSPARLPVQADIEISLRNEKTRSIQ